MLDLLRILLIFGILFANLNADLMAQDSKKERRKQRKEMRAANKRHEGKKKTKRSKSEKSFDRIYAKYEYTEKEKAMRMHPVLLDTMSRADKRIYYGSYRKDKKRKKALEKYKRERFLSMQGPETRKRIKRTAKNAEKRRRKARGNIFQRMFGKSH